MSNQPITQVTDNGETPALTPPPFTRAASAAARFRQLLATPDFIQCPVIYDVLSAKLSAQLGFPALYAGGQTVSASMYGIGDYGTITTSELIEFAARVVDAVDVPVVGDADDGGGSPLNVYRTIQRYERVGVACVMIEDMYGTKHLPGMPEGPMTSIDAFVDKILAAVDARRDDLVILARCDSLSAKEPFEKGLERLAAYAEAGADVVFLAAAPIRQTPRIAEVTKRPVMTVPMPTDPDAAPEVLRQSQVKIACYAYQLLAVALGAVQQALQDIKSTGHIQNFTQRAISWEGFAQLTDAASAVEIARRFNAVRP